MKEKKKEKSRASMIIDGDIEPNDNERYLLNLRKRKPFNEWDKDEHRKVCQMGNKALRELHGEQKTARESLKAILTLKVTDELYELADIDSKIADKLRRDNPNATIYDLVQAVAVGKALDGNMTAYQLIRDTNGDKPTDKVDITSDIMTESDRAMIEKLSARIDKASDVLIVKDIETDDTEKRD